MESGVDLVRWGALCCMKRKKSFWGVFEGGQCFRLRNWNGLLSYVGKMVQQAEEMGNRKRETGIPNGNIICLGTAGVGTLHRIAWSIFQTAASRYNCFGNFHITKPAKLNVLKSLILARRASSRFVPRICVFVQYTELLCKWPTLFECPSLLEHAGYFPGYPHSVPSPLYKSFPTQSFLILLNSFHPSPFPIRPCPIQPWHQAPTHIHPIDII